MIHYCVLIVVTFFSIGQSTANGVSSDSFPKSRNDLTEVQDLLDYLTDDDSNLPESQRVYIPEPSPLHRTDYVPWDSIKTNDRKQQELSSSRRADLLALDSFRKRDSYEMKRSYFAKRNNLNELLKRLMALKGNSYTGRAYLLRYGPGRK